MKELHCEVAPILRKCARDLHSGVVRVLLGLRNVTRKLHEGIALLHYITRLHYGVVLYIVLLLRRCTWELH
eukprot:9477668-Pyramimonas_sp.AAC.1